MISFRQSDIFKHINPTTDFEVRFKLDRNNGAIVYKAARPIGIDSWTATISEQKEYLDSMIERVFIEFGWQPEPWAIAMERENTNDEGRLIAEAKAIIEIIRSHFPVSSRIKSIGENVFPTAQKDYFAFKVRVS